jgi:hypothetical protein
MIKQGSFNMLSAFLKDNNQILIPDLQRDYCWGNIIPEGQKETLAHNFTEELLELSRKVKTQNKIEISYGIIYTYEYPTTFFYLCDGQQRLTTIYLIIGVLNTYLKNNKLIGLLKLINNQPRLKYEIRNSTDSFIKYLLKIFLNHSTQNDLSDLTKASWYRKEFDNDPSIKSIIAAVKTIHTIIKKDNAILIEDFILNKMGFVCVNLKGNENLADKTYSKVREYGEKMYEIVNTSGDPMEPNEHLKALLISKVPESEKELWTEKWELWQDFFWVHKNKDDESADEGFNEFLSWVKTLMGKNIEIDSIEVVEKYFKALILVFSIQTQLIASRKYKILNITESLHKKSPSKLVVILPALAYLQNTSAVSYDGHQYVTNQETVDLNALFRYLRFFSNISKHTEASSFAVDLVGKLNQGDDVTRLLNYSSKLSTILSSEEIYKLKLYKLVEEDKRIELENIFWEAEDHDYMNGKIEPIFKWLKIDFSIDMSADFDSLQFIKLYETFLSLVSEDNIDKTRFCLLAICNDWWQFHDGSSWGVPRYYLGTKNDFNFWQRIASLPEFGILIKKTFKNQIDDLFLNESIMKNEDVEQRKAYRKLKSEATKQWQWNNSYRFFIKDNVLCFPNGVQAKGNTAEIQL